MEENQIASLGKVVAIGGSAGSLEVILKVLPMLDHIDPIVILLILHRRNSDDNVLEELLRMKSGFKVIEIEDKTTIEPGRIYVAPADYHLLIETNGTFSLDVSEKINYSRPSIDVAFEATADVFGRQLTAILLSGANSDGTAGLIAVQKAGGTTLVQDPETADVPFMPAFALKNLKADYVMSPAEIGAFIKGLIG